MVHFLSCKTGIFLGIWLRFKVSDPSVIKMFSFRTYVLFYLACMLQYSLSKSYHLHLSGSKWNTWARATYFVWSNYEFFTTRHIRDALIYNGIQWDYSINVARCIENVRRELNCGGHTVAGVWRSKWWQFFNVSNFWLSAVQYILTNEVICIYFTFKAHKTLFFI